MSYVPLLSFLRIIPPFPSDSIPLSPSLNQRPSIRTSLPTRSDPLRNVPACRGTLVRVCSNNGSEHGMTTIPLQIPPYPAFIVVIKQLTPSSEGLAPPSSEELAVVALASLE
jgi:hypothetical protein